MIDFFISYNKADRAWAEWIAWKLEEVGYSTVLQAWDFRAGGNFVLDMQKAAREAERTIAVLSPDYLNALFTQPEWAAALARDPSGEKALLLPVRIREYDATGLLHQITHVDLVGLNEAEAKEVLLARVKGERLKPTAAPRFPGAASQPGTPPAFPGGARDYSRLLFKEFLLGSGDELFCVAFSRDGTWVAAGSFENVFLWDRSKGHQRSSLPGHGSYVYSVAFSHDSRFLVSGCEDRLVRLFDLRTGNLIWAEKRHNDAVYSVAFSPDGKSVVSGGYDKVVNLWNAETGELQRAPGRALDGIGRVTSVAFSPDGESVAFASLDDTVRLWDLHRDIFPLKGHTSSVEAVAFSPDGSLLASCGLDKTVRVWDLARKKAKWIGKEHEYLVRSVAFSPDGETLASAGWDKTVILWDAKTDVKTGVIKRTLPFKPDLPWHTDWIWSVAFSPEGMTLASSGSDGQIILWLVAERDIAPAGLPLAAEGKSGAA